LELIDSRFHTTTGPGPITVVDYNNSPVFNEICVDDDEERIIPCLPDYKPVVRFAISTAAISDSEASIASCIHIPIWCCSQPNPIAQLYMRLYLGFFLPKPWGIWTWMTSTNDGGEIMIVPYAGQISFTGISDNVIYLIIPQTGSNMRPPLNANDSDGRPLSWPEFSGTPVEFSYFGQALPPEYPVWEWLDEYIDLSLDPTIIVNFINQMATMLGCHSDVNCALDRMRALVWRIAPLTIYEYPDVIKTATAEPRVNSGLDADVSFDVPTSMGTLPTYLDDAHYMFTCGTVMKANQITTGVFIVKEADKPIALNWPKHEYALAQIQTRIFAMSFQCFFDSLGLSIQGIIDACNTTDNDLVRNFFYNLFSGGTLLSNGFISGQLGAVIENVATNFFDWSFPRDNLGKNLLAYKRVYRGIRAMYNPDDHIADDLLRPAFYQDLWMENYVSTLLLDYCQPPAKKAGGVRLSINSPNELPLGPNPGTVGYPPPWDLTNAIYIAADGWFQEDNHERRTNRRVMLWLTRHLLQDLQPTITTTFMTALGSTHPVYNGLSVAVYGGGTAAVSPSFAKTDINPAYANKLDVFPYIETGSWNWIVIGPSIAQPGNLDSVLSMLANNLTYIPSRLIMPSRSTEPIHLIPGRIQRVNPYEKYYDTPQQEASLDKSAK
jgi:hypothetical protein